MCIGLSRGRDKDRGKLHSANSVSTSFPPPLLAPCHLVLIHCRLDKKDSLTVLSFELNQKKLHRKTTKKIIYNRRAAADVMLQRHLLSQVAGKRLYNSDCRYPPSLPEPNEALTLLAATRAKFDRSLRGVGSKQEGIWEWTLKQSW